MVDVNDQCEVTGEDELEQGLEINIELDELMTISLQAFTGVTGYQTIRVTFYHKKRPLQVLIDIGSTHNFIDEELAGKLGCKPSPIAKQSISVADGKRVQTASAVFELVVRHQLYAKPSKCAFGVHEVEYLRHFISAKEVATDPIKISAVKQWPVPTTVKQLKGFLRLAGYSKRFIQVFGAICKPLNQLLRKDNFNWTDEAITAFEKLKNALATAPVLAMLDYTKPFIIETDASGIGIGVVLMQQGHPIAYITHLPLAEWWYNIIYHNAIKCTPYEVFYGDKPPIHLSYLVGEVVTDMVDLSLAAREVVIQLLKFHLARAQQRIKDMANKHRKISVASKPFNKLVAKYFGHYPITAKVGVVAYRLLLLVDVLIHPTFHLSQLKKFHEVPTTMSHPPVIHLSSPYCPEPEGILSRRLVNKGNKVVCQVLVKWSGVDVAQATWEYLTDLQHRFPSFALEGKGVLD
ncbi:putative mitochondrial protein [Nicotiana attenuata]|uniref:Mitochondrial protein n=1 Tax=Nicotiana attenuata TaxID=49451 RepID=A0A1J6J3N7_NICAT|nr:putative mitochondrial protein [Nicotiana attenuata]